MRLRMTRMKMMQFRSKLVCFIGLAGLVVVCLACPACTTTDRPLGDNERFSLTLRSASTDRRYTYFDLTELGELSFGGGQAAVWREAEPVMNLTAEQRQHIARILNEHDLFNMKSPKRIDDVKTQYELRLQREGLVRRTIRSADDQLPGVRVLHDYLFALQAKRRYDLPLPGG